MLLFHFCKGVKMVYLLTCHMKAQSPLTHSSILPSPLSGLLTPGQGRGEPRCAPTSQLQFPRTSCIISVTTTPSLRKAREAQSCTPFHTKSPLPPQKLHCRQQSKLVNTNFCTASCQAAELITRCFTLARFGPIGRK